MCVLSSMLPQPKGATFLGKVNSALPGFHKPGLGLGKFSKWEPGMTSLPGDRNRLADQQLDGQPAAPMSVAQAISGIPNSASKSIGRVVN